MTEGQFYAAMLGVLGALGTSLIAMLRWAVGRVVKAIERNTDAMLANTASNAKLGEKIDSVSRYVQLREPTPNPGVAAVR